MKSYLDLKILDQTSVEDDLKMEKKVEKGTTRQRPLFEGHGIACTNFFLEIACQHFVPVCTLSDQSPVHSKNLEFSDWSPFPKDKPRFKGRPNYEIYKIYQRLHGVLIHLQSNSHSINDLNMERLFKDFTKGDFGFWRIFDGNWRKFPGYYLHMTSKKHEENELEKDGNAPVALPLDINSDDLLYINF
ncbi:unnamed protein product, partial [Mesorhabditis spiculigera]